MDSTVIAKLKNFSLSSRQITVVVGTEESARNFYTHENLISQHSEFFANALRTEGQEAEDTVRRPDDDPECFEIFARFVYTGRIFCCVDGDTGDDIGDREWSRLAKCWILGDKLSSTTFKDAISDTICEKFRFTKCSPIDLHQPLYPSSASTAPIRRLLVDIAVWGWTAETYASRTMHESWNQFFKDLALRLCTVSEQERKDIPPFVNQACKYHEHVAAETPCYRTMF